MYLLGNITAYLSDDIVAQYFGIVKACCDIFSLVLSYLIPTRFFSVPYSVLYGCIRHANRERQ